MSSKRIIVPHQRSGDGTVRIDKINNVSGMLERALGIIDEQLLKIGLKSRMAGGILDDKETKALHGHVRALVELSKEEREREKSNKDLEAFTDMSNEELLQLANEQLNKQKDVIKPKT